MRTRSMSAEQIEKVRKEGWDLATLQDVVDQFVIHFDVCGTSRRCFGVLHDERGLSVHFMLDLDGTIYQTLDLKESAWHATQANSRSVGVEIANMGTFKPGSPGRLSRPPRMPAPAPHWSSWGTTRGWHPPSRPYSQRPYPAGRLGRRPQSRPGP